MIDIEDYELLCAPVPKAASTSVRLAVAGLAGLRPDQVDPAWLQANMPTHPFNADWFNAREGWFRFAVIRDPIQRLLSVWTDLVAKEDVLERAAQAGHGPVDLPTRPDPNFFFQNLDAYRRRNAMVNHHATPQTAYTGADLFAYDRVYHTGELAVMANDLSMMTGRLTHLPPARVPGPALSFDDLNGRTRDVLIAETGQDYDAMDGLFAQAA